MISVSINHKYKQINLNLGKDNILKIILKVIEHKLILILKLLSIQIKILY